MKDKKIKFKEWLFTPDDGGVSVFDLLVSGPLIVGTFIGVALLIKYFG